MTEEKTTDQSVADKPLSQSFEDYIEAIYDLHLKSGGTVRSVDIANELGFSKASVTRATKTLRELGYIEQERYGEITLTEKGAAYGKRVLERHRVLRGFLIDMLGVDEATANEEACQLEHCISQDTMDKWKSWYDREVPQGQSAVDKGLL